MKALTFHQPWAWLIATGVKDVENRRYRINYRGTLAIHAGMTSDDVTGDDRVARAVSRWPHEVSRWPREALRDAYRAAGQVVGTVEVTGCHAGTEVCCRSVWAQAEYAGNPVRWHVELADAVLLAAPVPARGMPGMWTLPADVYDAVLGATP